MFDLVTILSLGVPTKEIFLKKTLIWYFLPAQQNAYLAHVTHFREFVKINHINSILSTFHKYIFAQIEWLDWKMTEFAA
mgnify:CR=1 FL=1